jgi:hypothetical protein
MTINNTLSLDISISGSGQLATTTALINGSAENFQVGTNTYQFPGESLGAELVLSTGTGNLQANQWYNGQRVVNATTYDLLNLSSPSSGLLNGLNQNLQLTYVKWILLVILVHDGTKKLQIGPQGQSNAWPGWWDGVTATYYDTEYWMLFRANDSGNGLGPAITGTTNVLPIYNPTGSAITYSIFIGGN